MRKRKKQLGNELEQNDELNELKDEQRGLLQASLGMP